MGTASRRSRSRRWSRALVIANGDCDVMHLASFPRDEATLVVAVDGGLRHCLAAGLRAHWFVGDGDSAPVGLPGEEPLRHLAFSPVKDASDLQLALDALVAEAIGEVCVFGVSGGRTDHLLFNWLLSAHGQWPFRLRLIDRTTDARVVRTEHPFVETLSSGSTFSVLALTPVSGLHIDGARYPLCDASLMPGDTLGLSNIALGGELTVTVRGGVLLVMLIASSTG